MNKKQKRFLFIRTALLVLLTLCMMGCGKTSEREYTASVILTGGSGRATIESPCKVTVKNGKATADIIWSSPNYDYMIIDGVTYYPVNTEGYSEFIIPVEFDKNMAVQADTTAMSTPHLIDYTLRFSLDDPVKELSEETEVSFNASDVSIPPSIPGLTFAGTQENEFATGFAIHEYSEGYTVISVNDGMNYLLVPEGKAVPEGIGKDISVLKLPLNRIYLAASGAMCHFDALDAVDSIRLSGIEREDWYIEAAKKAMDEGNLVYGGKYSAPDYEKMVMDDIDLAVENTMILHVPKVQEKLEKIGIPVFVDRSSYEEEPLGRCEWIKVYGAIAGKEAEAESAFETQKSLVEQVQDLAPSGKTVAFFYVNSNHQIVTRKKNDYLAKMVAMAGGTYLAPDTGDDDNSNGQITISMEAFYQYALDADILIYNSAVADAPDSLEALCQENSSFRDFKAIGEGNVWYTDKSLYQYTDRTGSIILNLHEIISISEDETEFFHRLR